MRGAHETFPLDKSSRGPVLSPLASAFAFHFYACAQFGRTRDWRERFLFPARAKILSPGRWSRTEGASKSNRWPPLGRTSTGLASRYRRTPSSAAGEYANSFVLSVSSERYGPRATNVNRYISWLFRNSLIDSVERFRICKGPDWRPGIFIQYTKPNSLARRCGLQPGDQILQCNRISFLQIDFSYVSYIPEVTLAPRYCRINCSSTGQDAQRGLTK